MVSQYVAIAVVQCLIERHPDMEPECIDLKDSFWTQSLFKRMGFEKRAATTDKVAIPHTVREEMELVFFHELPHKVEKYKIPHSLRY